ncbi:MAG TPA: amidohydrolase [Jatrophihabitans sp.]|nr:amidohydrolase [Jatrophihabitans sp.]
MSRSLTAETVLTGCALAGGSAGERVSVAIWNGRIGFVGREDDVRAMIGTDTVVYDARGRVVAPGFIDSHTHFHRASVMEDLYLNFAALAPRSLDDVLHLVRERAQATPADEWVQGDSLESSRLREKRLPTRNELDAVAPGRCVVLRTVGRHGLAASSAALDAAGIDTTTQAPPGGRIERDPDGRPNGILHEHGKLRLDMTRGDTVVPKPSTDQRRRALEAGMTRLAAHGITAIHDIVREPVEIADYIDLDVSGRLRVRIRMYVRGRESQTPLEYLAGLGLRAGFGSERLRLAGVKVSIDGDLVSRNSAVYEPYPGEPDNRGLLRLTQAELDEAVARSHDAMLPVAVHAIGPRAVDMALDAIERAQERTPQHRLNHRIEHAFFDQREARLKRFAELGVVWSTQPSMLFSTGDGWLAAAGADFLDGVLPLRTALGLGVAVQINSDYPCSPLDPFVGLRACVDRTTRDGVVLAGEEAITAEEALGLMSAAPAATVGEQSSGGSLAVGCWADVIVLSPDPSVADREDVLGMQVDATFVGGQLVWERCGTDPSQG